MMSSRLVTLLVVLILAFTASSHNQHPRDIAQASANSTVQVGLILNGSPSNLGWDYNHDLARIAMESKYGKDIVVFVVRENVGYQEVLSTVEELVRLGCQLIIFGSDYQELRGIAVDSFKQTRFLSFGAYHSTPNQADVAVNTHEAYFLAGILAGLTSRSAKAGYMTAFYFAAGPSANAMYYGGRMVNPSFDLISTELQNWSEVTRARKAVEIMKETHKVDFITSVLSNSEVQLRSSRSNITTFGYPSELTRVLYGERVLSGCVLKWQSVYDEVIQMMLTNSWKQNFTFNYGLEEGIIEMASFSSQVSADVIRQLQLWIGVVKKKKLCPNDFAVYAERIKTVFPSDVKDSKGCVLFPLLGYKSVLDPNIIDLGYLSDDQVFSPVYVHFDEQIALVVIVGFVNFLIILSFMVVFLFRHTVLIISTNQYFCYGFLLGALFGYSDILFWIGQPTDMICHARVWFLAISFSLVFGSLMAKTYQVWRMWYNPQLKETKNTKLIILILLGIMWTVQIVLLIAMSVVNGYKSSKDFSSDLSYDAYYVNCSLSNGGLIIGAILLAFNGLIMIGVAVLAYISRNVSKKFTDVHAIVLSVYSIIVSSIIIILLFVNLKTNDPSVQLKIIACGIFIYITLPLLTVFGSKFKVLIFDAASRSQSSKDVSKTSRAKEFYDTK